MGKSSDEKKDPIEQEIQNLDQRVIYIMIAGAIILIGMPILVTQLNWFLDFSKPGTGAIGDTIGGITSPVIGVISALLIYFSFRAQVNANRIIQKQITDQKDEALEKKEYIYQIEIYKHIEKNVNNYIYINTFGERYIPYEKYAGIRKLLTEFLLEDDKSKIESKNYFFVHDFLNLFEWVIKSFEKSLIEDYDIRLNLQLVERLFRIEIWNEMVKHIEPTLNDKNLENTRVVRIYKRINDINLRLNILIQKFEKDI